MTCLGQRFADPLRQCDLDLSSFRQLIEHVLDFDAVPDMRIKPEHREELVELAAERDRMLAEVEEVHQAVQEEWSAVSSGSTIRLEAHKDEGFVMRLPSASSEQTLRKEIPQVPKVGALVCQCRGKS